MSTTTTTTTTTTPVTHEPAVLPVVKERIGAVDGLRAMATTMVFIFHVYEFAGQPAGHVTVGGRAFEILTPLAHFPAGVDLFMVLSGFCLFLPLAIKWPVVSRRPWNWREYAVRRVRRIVPPYYAAIAFTILLPQVLVIVWRLLGKEGKWQVVPSAGDIITHLLFIHTLFPQYWDGITGSFWSLGLEAQFYLAFPFVIMAVRRWGIWPVLAGMTVVSMAWRAGTWATMTPEHARLAGIFFLGRWMQFAAGMGAAWIVVQIRESGRPVTARQSTGLLLAAVGAYLLSKWVTLHDQDVGWLPARDMLLAAAFGAVCVVVCVARSGTAGFVRRFLESKPARFIGYISYSIFLTHQPTAWYVSEALRRGGMPDGGLKFVVLITAGAAVTLGVAYVFFLIFEKPFLNKAKTKESV